MRERERERELEEKKRKKKSKQRRRKSKTLVRLGRLRGLGVAEAQWVPGSYSL